MTSHQGTQDLAKKNTLDRGPTVHFLPNLHLTSQEMTKVVDHDIENREKKIF